MSNGFHRISCDEIANFINKEQRIYDINLRCIRNTSLPILAFEERLILIVVKMPDFGSNDITTRFSYQALLFSQSQKEALLINWKKRS